MKYFIRSVFGFFIVFTTMTTALLANKDSNSKSVVVKKDSFKVFKFDKIVSNIKVSNKDLVEVEFVKNKNKPLQMIRVFTKSLGNANIFVLFEDNTSKSININITQNLETIIGVAKVLSPKLKVEQINKKVILSGKIKNQKQKNKILNLFKKADVDLEKDLVDLTSLSNPDKMIRVKLYAVEINNDKGLDLKNNWFVSSKNYMEVKDTNGNYYNEPLNSFGAGYKVNSYKEVTNSDGETSIVPDTWSLTESKERSYANNQRNSLVSGAIDNLMQDAVSLTGGLTGAANYLGKYFNAGLTLNYLSSKGVAEVLDETTLLTLENKEADFLAGGTFNIKTQTTTAQGLPSTELKEIKYDFQE